jgi:hypothetical protein
VFDAALPFGGYKQSGWGREMGEDVLHNYTEVKASFCTGVLPNLEIKVRKDLQILAKPQSASTRR